jgi:hypothetical protein
MSAQGVGGRARGERGHWEDPDVDGMIILTHCGPVFFPLYLSQIINSKLSHVF